MARDNEFECLNYNEFNRKRTEERKNASFSFLQIGHPKSFAQLFFIAVTKREQTGIFKDKILKLDISLIVLKSNKLRTLEETEETDIKVDCSQEVETNKSMVFYCDDNKSGKIPYQVDIMSNSISGVPDDTIVESNPNPDY